MWTSSSCLVQPYQTGPWICVVRLGIRFQNLNLLHFDQIISLKSLSINLFLLARLNWVLVDEAPSPSLTGGTVFRKREREKKGCLNGVKTYLPGTVVQAV